MIFINKINFLRFAPYEKRIAYAPSIGGKIEDYNRSIFKKYINGIKYLSVREILGAKEIKKLTGRDAVVALDPTLLVENSFWREREILPSAKEDFMLCYFLNEPSELAVKHIKYLSEKYKLPIKLLPYKNKLTKFLPVVKICEPSPFEFIGYFSAAKFVCTDSFHGLCFSLSYNKIFLPITGNIPIHTRKLLVLIRF